MITRADGTPVWVPETTIAILDRAVAERPDGIALICADRQLSYRDYGKAVARLAARLAAAGAGGKAVAIVLRNDIEVCIAIFAVHAAAGTVAALNPDYTASELAPMFADARPVVTLTHADLADRLAPLGPGEIWTDIDTPASSGSRPDFDPQSIATLQFTGGTTGRPKGVMLSHRAVATNVAQREAVLPTQFGEECIICMMPLFHSFAMAMGLHLAAYAAGTLVILPRYRPDAVMDAIERYGVTRLPAGPTVFNSLLNFEGLDRERLSTVRCAYSGSAPLSADTVARWQAATGIAIYEGYGQSEAGPILTYHGPDMPLKLGSVGPAVAGTELEIVGGGVGEIRARGPQIMTGYLGQPQETAAAVRDGWLHTGDIGRIDDDGYVFIEDRKKDMAIVGGYNVYPREIDEVLMAHPGVVEAAAVGTPDAYRGEVIWAFVVGAVTEADLREHCATALVRYKHPAVIRFVESLPRTSVGKVDKQALKAMARRETEEHQHVA